MNQSRSHSFLGILTLLASVAVGCGDTADVFHFTERNISTTPGEPVGSVVAGVGGMAVGPEPFAIGGASSVYFEGGYAGGMAIVDDNGEKTFVLYKEVCFGISLDTGTDDYAISFWDAASCRAGSLCSTPCEKDSDCTGGPLVSECQAIPGSPQKICTLPCQTDTDCENGMICGEVYSDLRSCLLPETPWAPGCAHFCMDESDDSREVLCGRDASCCEGLSCSPSGECQARECLPAAWACSEEGVPCCEGLTCTSGYCSTP